MQADGITTIFFVTRNNDIERVMDFVEIWLVLPAPILMFIFLTLL